MPYCCSESNLSVIFLVSLTVIMLFLWTAFVRFSLKKRFDFIKMANYVLLYCLLDRKYYPSYLLLTFHFITIIIIMLLLWLFVNGYSHGKCLYSRYTYRIPAWF